MILNLTKLKKTYKNVMLIILHTYSIPLHVPYTYHAPVLIKILHIYPYTDLRPPKPVVAPTP